MTKKQESSVSIDKQMVDCSRPEVVEVLVRDDRTVVWVNVDGICRLRASKIIDLQVHDQAKEVKTILDFCRACGVLLPEGLGNQTDPHCMNCNSSVADRKSRFQGLFDPEEAIGMQAGDSGGSEL